MAEDNSGGNIIQNYEALAANIRSLAESASPVGSLKAFTESDRIDSNFLAQWEECSVNADGAHVFSEETVKACKQVNEITGPGTHHCLTKSNSVMKWAECDGTFPLPMSGEYSWIKEDGNTSGQNEVITNGNNSGQNEDNNNGNNSGQNEDITNGNTSAPVTAKEADNQMFVPNLNGNKNEEVFLAGSVNPDRLSYNSEMLTSNAGFSTRYSHQAVVFKGAMYVIGGYNNISDRKNDVWMSTDGESWQELTSNANFSPRERHQAVVFKDDMYVIGGYDGSHKNDVWMSTDGESWQELTSNANFSARSSHQVVVFDNAMYVIGGNSGSGIKNDVWKSTNGSTWTQEEPIGEIFSPRYNHQAVVFNNAMYVIGGRTSRNTNDVWMSTDGKNWEDVTPSNSIFTPRVFHQVVVFKEAMYVIGGFSSGYKNDVWKSTNGRNWTQEAPGNSTFSPRRSHQAVVFDNAMYVIGGDGNSGGYDASGYKNDVWTIQEENISAVSNNFKAISIAELPAHTHDITHDHTANSSRNGSHTHNIIDVDGSPSGTRRFYGLHDIPNHGYGGSMREKEFLTSDGAHSHGVTVNTHNGDSLITGGGMAFDKRPRHALVKYYIRVQ